MSTSGSHQNQAQSGAQNGSFSGSTNVTNTPNVPYNIANNYNNAQNNITTRGLTGAQTTAQDFLGSQLGSGAQAVTRGIHELNGLSPQYQNFANSGYTPYSAQSASAPGSVGAQSGAANMSSYQNPYTNDVVRSSLAGYDNNTAMNQNAMRASRGANSAFGDRSAVADAVYQGQSDLGRGQLESGLRNQGFNTAAGYGQQDASRNLQADQGNQSTQAGINMFNTGQANQVSQANAANQMASNQFGLSSLGALGNNIMNQSGLALQGVQSGQNNALNLFNTGTTGQGQLINVVGAGNPFIGSNISTGTSGQSSGTSSGTGSGSGKNSGVSL